ncbi:hypothetical protein SLS59_008074 [Nothophoma quercina]|uniref:Uncharacterized protein n=1 Tax=Nothophoma quercina TaxID=749835 RepID=A0ABR3QV88_9PLEO
MDPSGDLSPDSSTMLRKQNSALENENQKQRTDLEMMHRLLKQQFRMRQSATIGVDISLEKQCQTIQADISKNQKTISGQKPTVEDKRRENTNQVNATTIVSLEFDQTSPFANPVNEQDGMYRFYNSPRKNDVYGPEKFIPVITNSQRFTVGRALVTTGSMLDTHDTIARIQCSKEIFGQHKPWFYTRTLNVSKHFDVHCMLRLIQLYVFGERICDNILSKYSITLLMNERTVVD